MSSSSANKPSKEPQPTWYKFMGLSFQLFVLIGGGTALGWWIQQRSGMKFPLWLLLCSFSGAILAFYSLWIAMRQEK
jgi:hypothetical protein